MPSSKSGGLRDARLAREMTQEELAERMGIAQVTVSRTELAENITLSTLHRYVEALGGELEISILFEDGERFTLG